MEINCEMKTVYVVVVVDLFSIMDLVPAKEFYFKYAEVAPAAFSAMGNALSFVEAVCKELRDEYSYESEVENRQLLKSNPLDVYPGQFYSCGHRIQVMEMSMASETIVDEERVQSMAFEKLVRHTWCYNVDGELLWESPDPAHAMSDFERYPYEERYKVGDLVYVIPQGIAPESESNGGDLAVVSEAPVSKNGWLASGQKVEDWNPFYTVDYLGDDSFLDHYHVPESSLLLARFSLPEEFAFLPLWSKFLRGELTFPDGLADRIRAQKVHLLRRSRYDFKSGTIVD